MAERDYLFQMRDELIAMLTIGFKAYTFVDTESGFEYTKVICIELPTGNLYYHVSDESLEKYFAHLKKREYCWDGTDGTQRSEHIRDYINGRI